MSPTHPSTASALGDRSAASGLKEAERVEEKQQWLTLIGTCAPGVVSLILFTICTLELTMRLQIYMRSCWQSTGKGLAATWVRVHGGWNPTGGASCTVGVTSALKSVTYNSIHSSRTGQAPVRDAICPASTKRCFCPLMIQLPPSNCPRLTLSGP
jgi:hypothetical protein